jgi:hypothetical protein
MRRIGILALSAAFALVGVTAEAALIDFRVAPWGPSGVNSETNGGVTVTAVPAEGTLAHTASGGFGVYLDPCTEPLTGWLCDDRDANEINGIEILQIDFAAPTQIQGVLITRLFPNEGNSGTALEYGAYRLNGVGPWTIFSSTSATGNLDLDIPDQLITRIDFGYAGIAGADLFYSDFSVAALRVAPEPASILLLGMGLAAAAVRSRRRRT